MQKRVRNFEARGLFDGGDVDVDDEDHWLLRQLATAATGEEDGEEGEGGGGGVDLKQVLHDPSKGAATLVQSAFFLQSSSCAMLFLVCFSGFRGWCWLVQDGHACW